MLGPVILVALLAGQPAQAQVPDTLTVKGLIKQLIEENSTQFAHPDSVLRLIENPADAARLVADFLERPATLNEILQDVLVPRSRLLKDLNLRFKTFTVDTLTSLGLSYDYSKKSLSKTFVDKDPAVAAVYAQVAAKGDVAFKRAVNPTDFLQTNVSGHLFVSTGGVAVLDSAAQAARVARRRELLMEAAQAANPETNEAARTLTAEMLQRFSPLWYADLAFAGGYESNQDFSATQLVFGLTLGLDVKPWGHHNANVFDYPFAAVRWLAGVEDWQPRASTFPTFLVGLDRIDPTTNTARERAGDTNSFNRVRAEVVFRTPILAGSYVEANVRYYKQLDPPAVIVAANLDEQIYFTTALTAPNGMFVSYTTGRLPFDQANDQIYALGFSYTF